MARTLPPFTHEAAAAEAEAMSLTEIHREVAARKAAVRAAVTEAERSLATRRYGGMRTARAHRLRQLFR